MDTASHPITARIARIRAELHYQHADAVLVPSSDPHLSEYLPARWQTREWASGFTGSMGTLVVTTESAVLFADSRYWSQAESELQGSPIVLEKIPNGATNHHVMWLAQQLGRGAVVLVDAQVLGLAAEKTLRSALEAVGAALRTDFDLFDTVWPQRPGLPSGSVHEHPTPYA
ncbi:MAG: aminopeptidase P family N-terminal domain-containing protein, partial [Rhodoferax sp.]